MIKDDKTYIKKYLEPQIVVVPHESSVFIYNFEQAHAALFVLKIQVPNLLCDASACNFTKSNTPPRVFFTFFRLYKWYQIA